MKDSIVKGGVKEGSESLLRALSGPPRCPLVGNKEVIYNFNIIYQPTSQTVDISSPFGFPNAPQLYPFARWVMDATFVINLPVSASSIGSTGLKLGMAQAVVSQRQDPLDPNKNDNARFLVKPGSYDKVTLKEDLIFGGGTRPASYGDGWKLVPETLGLIDALNGPDLYSLLSVDLGKAGTYSTRQILPEQSEFCVAFFVPFLFCETGGFVGMPLDKTGAWKSGCGGSVVVSQEGSVQTSGWSIRGFGANLYPQSTVIGTLTIRFRRSETLPLFLFTLLPPRVVRFTNLTFYNPALAPVWDWDFGDGSAHVSDASPVHSYAAAGKYKVTLKVTDATGDVKTFDQIVNMALTPNFSFRISKNVVRAGGRVSEAVFTDLSIGPSSWRWDFGDGASSTQQNPTHDYPVGGAFNCTLTISDLLGNTASTTQTINT